MTLRVIISAAVAFLMAGCGGPENTQVDSTELRFRSYTNDVLTFDAEIRKGDAVCWRHGDNGSAITSISDRDELITLTVSVSADYLEIGRDNKVVQRIPVEKVVFHETPVLKSGKYHVVDYVQKLGVARSPLSPLYLYVKKRN